MEKLQPKYQPNDRVQYNSLSYAGACHGTILEVNNDKVPHVYKIQSDVIRDKQDMVEEQHIFGKI